MGAKQPDLYVQDPAVADTVTEHGMRHLPLEPPLPTRVDSLSPFPGQADTGGSDDKV